MGVRAGHGASCFHKSLAAYTRVVEQVIRDSRRRAGRKGIEENKTVSAAHTLMHKSADLVVGSSLHVAKLCTRTAIQPRQLTNQQRWCKAQYPSHSLISPPRRISLHRWLGFDPHCNNNPRNSQLSLLNCWCRHRQYRQPHLRRPPVHLYVDETPCPARQITNPTGYI